VKKKFEICRVVAEEAVVGIIVAKEEEGIRPSNPFMTVREVLPSGGVSVGEKLHWLNVTKCREGVLLSKRVKANTASCRKKSSC